MFCSQTRLLFGNLTSSFRFRSFARELFRRLSQSFSFQTEARFLFNAKQSFLFYPATRFLFSFYASFLLLCLLPGSFFNHSPASLFFSVNAGLDLRSYHCFTLRPHPSLFFGSCTRGLGFSTFALQIIRRSS